MNIQKHNLYLIFSFLILISYLVFMILNHPNYIVDDCGLFFICAKRIIQGQIPYIDFIEHNPPLIYLLNIVPALINLKFGLNIALSFSFYILLIISIIFIFLYYILFKTNLLNCKYQTLLYAYIVLNFNVFNTFGQREHLIILLTCPFLLVRYLKYNNIKVRNEISYISGFLFGLGIFLKPWYLLAYLAYEVGLIIVTTKKIQNFIFELMGTITIFLFYSFYLISLPQNAFNIYMHSIFLLSAVGYRSFDPGSIAESIKYLNIVITSLPNNIYLPLPLLFPWYLILLFFLNYKYKVKFIADNLSIGLFLFSTIIIYLLIPPILEYHCIPIQFAFYWFTISSLYLSNEIIKEKKIINFDNKYPIPSSFILMILLVFPLLRPFGPDFHENPFYQVIQTITKPNEKILTLGSVAYLLPELSNRLNANKYMPEGYPVNEFIEINSNPNTNQSIKELSYKLENDYLSYLNNLIFNEKPKLIIIQASRLKVLNWLSYFEEKGFFDNTLKSYKIINKGFRNFDYNKSYIHNKIDFPENNEYFGFLYLVKK